MIVKTELLKKIRHYFNLNIYEAKVWFALLSKGTASAGEIATISGVPRSRTYDVLESLEKQGFAIEKLDKPIKYLAVKPAVVIEKLKNNALKEAEEKTEILSKLKDSGDYGELEMLHKQGIELIEPEDLSGAIKGKNNLISQLREMIENAESEVIFVTTLNALQQEIKFLKPLAEKLNKHDVSIKVALNAKPEEIRVVEKELKADIRQTNLNARFCIIDAKHILFMLSDKHDEEIGIWLNSEFFASALKQLFEITWHNK